MVFVYGAKIYPIRNQNVKFLILENKILGPTKDEGRSRKYQVILCTC